MTRWHWLGGVLLFGAMCAPGWSDEKQNKDNATIDALIEQLGSETFNERQKAQQQLAKFGRKALEKLQLASQGEDAETRRRARILVTGIELELATEAMLAPKKVKIVWKDTPIFTAIGDLEKASGYRISWGNITGMTNRKITMTLDDVPFAEALDRLCEKGNLVQSRGVANVSPTTAERNLRIAPVRNKAPDPKQHIAGPFKPERPSLESIVLNSATPRTGAVAYTGSLCIRSDRASPKADEVALSLDASAEPRLVDFRVVGVQEITKAIDDQGQSLTLVGSSKPASRIRGSVTINGQTFTPRPPAIEDRSVNLSLKKGAKESTTLRELSGTLQVSAMQEVGSLASLSDVANAKGKVALGRDGYSMKIESVSVRDNGNVQLTVNASQPVKSDPDAAAMARVFGGRGNIVINGMRVGDNPITTPPPYPRLFDEKAQAWELVQVTDQTLTTGKEQRECTFTLLYRPPAKGAKAAKLSLYAVEPTTINVPFTLKDVPLR